MSKVDYIRFFQKPVVKNRCYCSLTSLSCYSYRLSLL